MGCWRSAGSGYNHQRANEQVEQKKGLPRPEKDVGGPSFLAES